MDECNKRTKGGDIFGTRWIEIRRIQNLTVFDNTKTDTFNMETAPASSRLEFFRRHNKAQMVWLCLVNGKRQQATIRQQLPVTKRITGRFQLTMKERMKE